MKSNYFENHICFTNIRGNRLARNEKKLQSDIYSTLKITPEKRYLHSGPDAYTISQNHR